jgi:hypothetical protein
MSVAHVDEPPLGTPVGGYSYECCWLWNLELADAVHTTSTAATPYVG